MSESSFARDDRVGSRGASEPKRHVLWFLEAHSSKGKDGGGAINDANDACEEFVTN